MDFELTPDQRSRCEAIRDGVRDGMLGRRGSAGETFSRTAWKEASALGLTGLCLPEEDGGGGLGALDTALCLAAFGCECADTGLVFAVAAHLLACAVPIRDYLGQAQRASLLRGLACGDLIAANAMTEDEAGSDVGALSMVAEPDGEGGYFLAGEKSFASNAPAADLIVTYAVTDPAAGFLGITGFVVPTDVAGVHIGPELDKMGLTTCPASRVRFERCHLPASSRLGEEGQGSAIFQHSMNWERACLPALYLGVMDRQLVRCVARVRQRRQFGHRIGEFQALSHRLAVMKQKVEAARLLLYRACWLIDQGRDAPVEIALAKVSVSEAAVANSLDAIQIFGGSGYLVATGIEANLRDSVPGAIFSGTSEIQREMIARGMGV
jgi:alkylation response protein AidB-like acyl-CoA dehydrogenase